MQFPLRPFQPVDLARLRKPSGRLLGLTGFGTNPGNLTAWFFKPDSEAGASRPLVVVLHGCTQTAASYDRGSGWSELAAEHGFATLFPEQQRPNNPNLCFNWFAPGDTRREAGEALSIVQMIGKMIEQHGVDPQRVYITGLSAGGAMTSVMLATYPELFAGGAVLAGLPYGAANGVPEALQQMRAHSPSSRTTGRSIQSASAHKGQWPVISIWHGTADTVVSPSNADAILRQWSEVHGVTGAPDEAGLVNGFPHRVWRDSAGKLLIEDYRVTGMGHGTPLAVGGDRGCGEAGAFMLDVGISATVQSAKTWSLLDKRNDQAPVMRRTQPGTADHRGRPAGHAAFTEGGADRITRVIEDALRTARLLK